MLVQLLGSGFQARAEEPAGPAVEGLQLSLSALPPKAGQTQFRVTFRNGGDRDVTLNLGMMLGNGKFLLPETIRLKLTDAGGKTRELHFSDRRVPGVAGRVDDYLVPLRAGSEYTLRLDLADFWSPGTEEFQLALGPGKNQISAHFEGKAASHVNNDTSALKLLNFWIGTLKSNTVTLEQ
jgi:hypothetical protein